MEGEEGEGTREVEERKKKKKGGEGEKVRQNTAIIDRFTYYIIHHTPLVHSTIKQMDWTFRT